MVKFKEGDKVRFVDTLEARADWRMWFERDFAFDSVMTVYWVEDEEEQYRIEIEESCLHFGTSPEFLRFASGQMPLPFEWEG
jgi:hypothetical protein